MFLVNSRLGQFTAAPSGFDREGLHLIGAPLIPKLRGHFAEFLNEGYLDHLSILYLSTCVGFGTGTHTSCLEDFLGGMASRTRRPSGQLASHLTVTGSRIYLGALATCLPPRYRRRGSLSLPRPPIGHNGRDVVREYQPVGHRLRLSASP